MKNISFILIVLLATTQISLQQCNSTTSSTCGMVTALITTGMDLNVLPVQQMLMQTYLTQYQQLGRQAVTAIILSFGTACTFSVEWIVLLLKTLVLAGRRTATTIFGMVLHVFHVNRSQMLKAMRSLLL